MLKAGKWPYERGNQHPRDVPCAALANRFCLAMLLLCSALLCGCGDDERRLNGKKVDVAEWQEEVRLHDGRTVIVWRKERAYAGGFPNARRGRDIDSELRFEEMGLQWKHEQTDSNLRNPISFEIFNGEQFLVLYAGDRHFCEAKPPDAFPVQAIKWVNGKWIEVSLLEFPLDTAIVNLSTNYWGRIASEDAKGLVVWDNKQTAGDKGSSVKNFLERFHRSCAASQKS
jgi:hypothetical protein